MNMVVQMGQQFIQLAQASGNPANVGIIAHELVGAIRDPWKKVMQYSDSTNVEEAMSVLNVLQRILPAPEDLGGMAGTEATANAQVAAGNGRGPGNSGKPGAGGSPEADARSTDMAALLASTGNRNGASAPMASRR